MVKALIIVENEVPGLLSNLNHKVVLKSYTGRTSWVKLISCGSRHDQALEVNGKAGSETGNIPSTKVFAPLSTLV